jgi:glyoxylase-like metal-dependent hydrolase (beta-lactamase superfamily II)
MSGSGWRRGVAAIALILLGSAGSGAAQSTTRPAGPLAVEQVTERSRLIRVTEDVYAFVYDNVFHVYEGGNVTVILTDEGVVVVDAPDSRLSRMHLEQIRRLTDKPVRYVLITHWHPDHIRGLHVYKDAFPEAVVIMQAEGAATADRRLPVQVAGFYRAEEQAATAERQRVLAETGVNPAGVALTGYALQRARDAYAEGVVFRAAALDAGVRYVSPDVVFSEAMTLRLGGKEIRLMGVRGHTDGDTVVYLPGERVLITGDILTLPVPFGANDFKYELMRRYAEFAAMAPAAIVPGHGEVQYDTRSLTLLSEMYGSLMAQAEASVAAGHTEAQFLEALNLERFETALVAGDAASQWGWSNYFLTAAMVQQAFQEAQGVR